MPGREILENQTNKKCEKRLAWEKIGSNFEGFLKNAVYKQSVEKSFLLFTFGSEKQANSLQREPISFLFPFYSNAIDPLGK